MYAGRVTSDLKPWSLNYVLEELYDSFLFLAIFTLAITFFLDDLAEVVVGYPCELIDEVVNDDIIIAAFYILCNDVARLVAFQVLLNGHLDP